MPLTIRPAEPDDVEAIFEIRTSVTENILDRAKLAEMGITPASITAMIRQSSCAWVAVEASLVVGFSMVDLEGGSLFAAFVLPSHEGRRIGRALVHIAEDALFQRHQTIWLETGTTTRAAGFTNVWAGAIRPRSPRGTSGWRSPGLKGQSPASRP